MTTRRSIDRFTILSLTEFDHLNLQLTTGGFAKPAAIATEAATDPLEDPLPLLLKSNVLKDDTILVNKNQSMLALAKMVE